MRAELPAHNRTDVVVAHMPVSSNALLESAGFPSL